MNQNNQRLNLDSVWKQNAPKASQTFENLQNIVAIQKVLSLWTTRKHSLVSTCATLPLSGEPLLGSQSTSFDFNKWNTLKARICTKTQELIQTPN